MPTQDANKHGHPYFEKLFFQSNFLPSRDNYCKNLRGRFLIKNIIPAEHIGLVSAYISKTNN